MERVVRGERSIVQIATSLFSSEAFLSSQTYASSFHGIPSLSHRSHRHATQASKFQLTAILNARAHTPERTNKVSGSKSRLPPFISRQNISLRYFESFREIALSYKDVLLLLGQLKSLGALVLPTDAHKQNHFCHLRPASLSSGLIGRGSDFEMNLEPSVPSVYARICKEWRE